MNERIKELAKQARQIGEYVNYGQIRLSPEQFEQKFAELVVKECMEVARPFYMGTPADSVYYVEQAINRIAEYFGVE